MKNIVVGTAGHIDHGKTALVKALTGIDADRLAEEKRRGITIDLGFAHIDLSPEIRAAFIDVPGHERFVKNMLAGVGGIDLVLFAVAADESIKPQTREHFDICRLLGIRRGIVALTKSDLVDPDILDLVRLEVEELVAGSFLEGAPIVPVSATTGAGLDDLRRELIGAAREISQKNVAGSFRLPIDRVFSIRGFGTVITGTLISGSISRDQEVEVHPSARRLRVRGVEVHGTSSQQASAGQRAALNLADIEPSELARGMVLTEPALFHTVRHLDARLTLLPSASPLKHRAPIHFHSGSAEIEAEVRLLEGRSAMQPGASAWVRIVLRDPALLLPGDRFIIRRFSPVITIGGGVVADIGERRYRKGDNVDARLTTLSSADVASRVALLVAEQPFGMGSADLVARTGLPAIQIAEGARHAPLDAIGDWYVDRTWMANTRADLVKTVAEYHRRNPLFPGIPRQDLRGGTPQPVFDAMLAGIKELVAEGELVRSRSHKVVLKDDEEQARTKIEAAFETAGLAVPSVNEVLAQSGLESSRAKSILQILLREKRLVRINAELVFHSSAIARLKELLAPRKGQTFAVPEFKDWTGISRKYAIPLLEFLDREHITRRDGDQRVIL